MALLDAVNLALGLVLWSSLVKVLEQFPLGFLGVVLMFSGIELAMDSRNTNSMEDCFVMLICTVVSLVGSDSVLGFACGIVVHLLLRLRNMSRVQQWCFTKKQMIGIQACPVAV